MRHPIRIAATNPFTGPTSWPAATNTSVEGVASWYGPGFHGHRTSSGAVYDQEDLTAASVLFPLGTRLLVTNLANNRDVEVTINDHGPYVKGRQIDLSRKAARVLGVIGPGTAHVRMEVLATPPAAPRSASATSSRSVRFPIPLTHGASSNGSPPPIPTCRCRPLLLAQISTIAFGWAPL